MTESTKSSRKRTEAHFRKPSVHLSKSQREVEALGAGIWRGEKSLTLKVTRRFPDEATLGPVGTRMHWAERVPSEVAVFAHLLLGQWRAQGEERHRNVQPLASK